MGYYARDGAYVREDIDNEPRIQPESKDPYIRTELESERQEKQKIQQELDRAHMGVRNQDIRPTYQQYGPAEEMSPEDIRILEASNRAQRNEVKPTYQFYGPAEEMSPEDIRILEAQNFKKKQQDIPYKDQIKSWIHNGLPTDEKEIDDVLNHALSSRVVLKAYFDEFNSNLSMNFHNLLKEQVPEEQVKQIYDQMKKNLNEYVRVLYKLRDKGLSFNPESLVMGGLIPIDKDMLEYDFMHVESKYGKITMGVPADLSNLYEDAKYQQREGNAGVVMTKVFDELNGKKVNWEGYINLRPGEKTPGQLYKERREERRKKYLEERQKQIQKDSMNREKMNTETWGKEEELEQESEINHGSRV